MRSISLELIAVLAVVATHVSASKAQPKDAIVTYVDVHDSPKDGTSTVKFEANRRGQPVRDVATFNLADQIFGAPPLTGGIGESISFLGKSGGAVLAQTCEESQPFDSPYKPQFRDGSGMSDVGGSWADTDYFKSLFEGGDSSTVPCVYSGIFGASKIPAAIDIQGAGTGNVHVTTRTTTSERSVNEQSSTESDTRFSIGGLTFGSKKSSSSESGSGNKATVDEQIVSTTGEVLVARQKQSTKSVCDDESGLCLEAFPQSSLDAAFVQHVRDLPVSAGMLKLAKKEMTARALMAKGEKAEAPSTGMLTKMGDGLRQVYLEFLTKYGAEVRTDAVLGVRTVIRSTKHTSEASSSSSSSTSSSKSADFEAFRPAELGGTGNKITTHTVVTTTSEDGSSKVQDKTKVISPPDPPAGSSPEDDTDALKEATAAAASMAANALMPGSGAAASLVTEKAVEVLGAIAKAKIEFTSNSARSRQESEADTESDIVTTIMSEGGDAFVVSASEGLIHGLAKQEAGAGNGLVELSSKTESIASYVPTVQECTGSNSPEVLAAMPAVASYTAPSPSESKETDERNRILDTLGLLAAGPQGTAKTAAQLLTAATSAYDALPSAHPVGAKSLTSADGRSGLSFFGAAVQMAFGSATAVSSFRDIKGLLVALSMAAPQGGGKAAAALGLDDTAAGFLSTRGVICEGVSCGNPNNDIVALAAAGADATLDAWAEASSPRMLPKSSRIPLRKALMAVAEINQIAMPTGSSILYTTSCVAGDAGDVRTAAVRWAPKLGHFVIEDAQQAKSFTLVEGLSGCDAELDFLRRPAVLTSTVNSATAGSGAAGASSYHGTLAVMAAVAEGKLRTSKKALAAMPREQMVPSGTLTKDTISIADAASNVATGKSTACDVIGGSVGEPILALTRLNVINKAVGDIVAAAATSCKPQGGSFVSQPVSAPVVTKPEEVQDETKTIETKPEEVQDETKTVETKPEEVQDETKTVETKPEEVQDETKTVETKPEEVQDETKTEVVQETRRPERKTNPINKRPPWRLLQSQAKASAGRHRRGTTRRGSLRARSHAGPTSEGSESTVTTSPANFALAQALDTVNALAMGSFEGSTPLGATEGLQPLSFIAGGLALDGAATASTETVARLPKHCLSEPILVTMAKVAAIKAAAQQYQSTMRETEKLQAPLRELFDEVASGRAPPDSLCKKAHTASRETRRLSPSFSALKGIIEDAPPDCSAYRGMQEIEQLHEASRTPGVAPTGHLRYMAALFLNTVTSSAAKIGLDAEALKADVPIPEIKTKQQPSDFFPDATEDEVAEVESDAEEESSEDGGTVSEASEESQSFRRAALGGKRKVTKHPSDPGKEHDGVCTGCLQLVGHSNVAEIMQSTGLETQLCHRVEGPKRKELCQHTVRATTDSLNFYFDERTPQRDATPTDDLNAKRLALLMQRARAPDDTDPAAPDWVSTLPAVSDFSGGPPKGCATQKVGEGTSEVKECTTPVQTCQAAGFCPADEVNFVAIHPSDRSFVAQSRFVQSTYLMEKIPQRPKIRFNAGKVVKGKPNAFDPEQAVGVYVGKTTVADASTKSNEQILIEALGIKKVDSKLMALGTDSLVEARNILGMKDGKSGSAAPIPFKKDVPTDLLESHWKAEAQTVMAVKVFEMANGDADAYLQGQMPFEAKTVAKLAGEYGTTGLFPLRCPSHSPGVRFESGTWVPVGMYQLVQKKNPITRRDHMSVVLLGLISKAGEVKWVSFVPTTKTKNGNAQTVNWIARQFDAANGLVTKVSTEGRFEPDPSYPKPLQVVAGAERAQEKEVMFQGKEKAVARIVFCNGSPPTWA